MGKKTSRRSKPPKKSSHKPARSAKHPAKKPAAKTAPAAPPRLAAVAALPKPPALAPTQPPMPPLPTGPAGARKRFELDKLRLASVRERRPAVRVEQFARIVPPVEGFRRFLDSLPDLSEAAALRTLVQRILAARK